MASADAERNALHLQNKTACRDRRGRRGLRETGEMSSILRDKSPALPSTACPWRSHCNRPHTGSESVTHCPWGARAHTGMQKHISAAAIIKHTITVRSEWLPCEREVKRRDWKRAFNLVRVLWLLLLPLFSQDTDDPRLLLLMLPYLLLHLLKA